MKIRITLVLLIIKLIVIAQDQTLLLSAETVKKLRVEKASTYVFYDSIRPYPDSILNMGMIERIGAVDSIEISTSYYNVNGEILLKRTLNPFIRSPLFEEFIYTYNERGLLVQELKNSTRLFITASSLDDMLDTLALQRDTLFPHPDTIKYMYDEESRLIEQHILKHFFTKYYPRTNHFQYNANGDLLKAIYKDNQLPYANSNSREETDYYYDQFNNLIKERFSSMGWVELNFSHSLNYVYNEAGKRTEMIYRSTGHSYRTKYFYKDGKLNSVEEYEFGSWDDIDSNTRYNGDQVTWYEKITYGYDLQGNLVQENILKNKDDKGRRVTYTYNAQNLLILKEVIEFDIPLVYKTFYSYN